MTQQEFEQLVEEGFAQIPEELRQKVSNVAVLVENEPSLRLRRKMNLSPHHTLLGLYEGIPHTSRQHYGVGVTLPDRITIFRNPIEAAAGGNPDKIRDVVRDTIQHEIAHHFGMDEHAIRRRQRREDD